MAEGRSVLGDITNRVRKRSVSEGEENGGRSLDFNKNNVGVVGKRSHLSPRPCNDLNSSKVNQNKESNILDLAIAFQASKSVNFCEGSGLLKIYGSVNQKNEEVNFAGLEGERGEQFVASEPDLSKENKVVESKSSCVNYAVGENIADLELHGSETMVGSSRMFNKQKDLNSFELGADDLRKASEKNDDCSGHQGGNYDIAEDDLSLGGTFNKMRDSQTDLNDVDKLVLSQSSFIDSTILSEAQESRVVELGTQVGNDSAYVSGKTDSIKDCCCSFCTKAGYIWLDLNYQDIKARLTATRKSQKEASILSERCWLGNKATAKHITEESNKLLESQLMYHWKSLFHHTANECEQESNQLEASLISLSDLKEKCKTQMMSAITDAMRSDKH